MPTLNLADPEMIENLDLLGSRLANRVLRTMTYYYHLQYGHVPDRSTLKRQTRNAVDYVIEFSYLELSSDDDGPVLGLFSPRRLRNLELPLFHFLDGDAALLVSLIKSDVEFVAGFKLDDDQWSDVLFSIHAVAIDEVRPMVKDLCTYVALPPSQLVLH